MMIMRMIMVIIMVIINSLSSFTLGSSGSKGSWLSSSCPCSSWPCAISNNLWNRAFHDIMWLRAGWRVIV